MTRVHLIHWDAVEGEGRADALRAAGYEVDTTHPDAAFLRRTREHPPAAVVIDLSRLPAQGRDLGIALRHAKTTRGIPLVFAGGEPEKISRVKQHLPDAVYTSWRRMRSSLKQAIARPPPDPVAPDSVFAGYSGVPLVKKLGIAEHDVVRLIGAPKGFEDALTGLPDGVTVRRTRRGASDLSLWFTKSRKELEARIESVSSSIGRGGLWILWPKRTSGVASDLSQVVVRRTAGAVGLVDYKIAAIDATWSGLRFTRRRSP